MSIKRGFLAVLVLLASAFAWAETPKLLIVQRLAPSGKDNDPNIRIAHHLAEALDAEGRVVPIVWAQSDPLFRKLLDDSGIGVVPEEPMPDEAYQFAKRLKLRYLLIVSVVQESGELLGSAALYENNPTKPIWTENRGVGVLTNGAFDAENSAQSLARSWSIALGAGALRRLPPRVKIDTSAAVTQPATPEVSNPVYDVRDFKKVDELVASGDLAQAIARLRDMVDFDPKNLTLREKLLHVLRLGYPAAAAEIASQLADSNPDKPIFRLHAAQSYLEAGKVQDATRELEIVKLQMPEDSLVVKLAGQLAMERGAWEEAKAAFDEALQASHDPKIKRLRGLAKAMMGDAAGARQDLQGDRPVGMEAEGFYQKAIYFADVAFKSQSDNIRSLIQRLKIADPSATTALAMDADRRCIALLELMKNLEIPSTHENSHRHRVLACSLLVQSSQELVLLAQQRSDDHAAEASLSLGEAIKTWTKASEAAAKESRPKG